MKTSGFVRNHIPTEHTLRATLVAIARFLPRPHFASLRSKLFAAFVGVLLLMLVLTGSIFLVETGRSDAQQVQQDVQAAWPNALTFVKQALARYPRSPSQSHLRGELATTANRLGVRILLVDLCNNILVDSGSTQTMVPVRVQAGCDNTLDDVSGLAGQPVPWTTNVTPSCSQEVRHTDSLPGGGTTYYVACSAPLFMAQQSQSPTLNIRTIIIGKSTASVYQKSIDSLLPELAAAGLLAVLLTLGVVAIIVRAIARPLHSITVASERIAAGDYDQRVAEAGDDEVGQLARSFNRMASEVSSARETQRQLIANVSHDLKTPLTSIVGFSQILADNDEVANDPTQRRAVQVINEEARRLQRLTHDLLDLSRLEAGQLQLRRALVDLNDLAGRALARYVDLPANAGLHFIDERCAGSLLVSGDADRLMQVLVNLLDNAVKFCDPEGSVALRTARERDGAGLTISNTGPGIAPEDLMRVFQRFYRTDRSRASRTGGTGLGLAIVREIVAAHGGTVEARNSGDGWTRFVLSIPLLPSDQAGLSPAREPRSGDLFRRGRAAFHDGNDD